MRLFLKIVMGLIVIVVLLAGVLLIPPHLQTLRVEPPLPSEAELRALLAVENGPVGVRYLNTSSQRGPNGGAGHNVFVIEWAGGELFMIDAGMDRATAAEFSRLIEFAMGASAAEIHGSVAELLGDDIERITGVAFTHLHIDHTQGVLAFCEARGEGARRYQTRWQAELHNFNTVEGAAIVAQSCLQPGELSGGNILTAEGFPGLGIVGLGGHTPGSTLFAAAIDDRLWLFSGDTTNSKANLLNNVGKGFLYSNILVPENTGRTEALRLWLTGLDANDDMTVVVSHDLADIEGSGMAEYQR